VWYIIESSEESGDEETLGNFISVNRTRIGPIDALFVLDSSAEDDRTVWFCESLRGGITAALDVQHLEKPCHSGRATGIVPSSFRIARALLSRIENEDTGEIKLSEVVVSDIPIGQIQTLYRVVGRLAVTSLCRLLPGARFLKESVAEMAVDRAWKAGLEITGADGLPSFDEASNVMRARTRLRISLRLPPTVNHKVCSDALKRVLEDDPPYGAKVNCEIIQGWGGWVGRPIPSAVAEALTESSKEVFGEGNGTVHRDCDGPAEDMARHVHPRDWGITNDVWKATRIQREH
jgi:acetylornithine deacetylase/succinyl-diaminopimelate desuccinylase-like protein